MSSAREKISLAAANTTRIDDLLGPALDSLARATLRGNGAGVYSDPSRVQRALTNAMNAIAEARTIAVNTDWPTAEDYDQ